VHIESQTDEDLPPDEEALPEQIVGTSLCPTTRKPRPSISAIPSLQSLVTEIPLRQFWCE
jgi:hypothetical protein